MDKRYYAKWILPLVTVIFIIKLIVVEYVFFISQLTEMYTLGTYIKDQVPVFLCYKIALVLFFVSWAYLMQPKRGLIYLAVLNLVNSCWVMGLSLYVKCFKQLPSMSSLYSITNVVALRESITDLLDFQYLLLFVDCILLLIVVLKLKSEWLPSRKRRIGAIYLATSLFIILWLPFYIEKKAEEFGDRPFRYYTQDTMIAVRYHSYITYCLRELSTLFNADQYSIELNSEQRLEIDGWFNERNALLGSENAAYKGIAKDKNVLLIQVESLETILINRSVNGKEVIPFINKLVEESLYYPNIYEQVKEGNSSDCEWMVNTSLYPSRDGVTAYQYSERAYTRSLANILKAKGYYNVVAHGDRKTFWNRNRLYPGLGYDAFWGIEDYENNEMVKMNYIGLGLGDQSFLAQTAEKMKALPEPYLASVITLTSHSPFVLPQDLKVQEFPEVKTPECRRYAEAFSYVDASLEAFFSKLDENHMLDNTLVVIYGDHEGLNKYYDVSGTWENQQRIPLIIYSKGMTSKMDAKVGGQIDILPTLLYLLDEEPETYSLMGKNLLRQNNGYALMEQEVQGDFGNADIAKLEEKAYQISEMLMKSNDTCTKYFNDVAQLDE